MIAITACELTTATETHNVLHQLYFDRTLNLLSVSDDKILIGAQLNDEERFEWISGVLVDDT